ncbi:MAG: MMPL family transporter, partial [Candidatus Dormibacteria bacterium]
KGLQQLIGIETNMTTAQNYRRGLQYLYGPTSVATVAATAAEGALLARVQQAEQATYAKSLADLKASGMSDADAQAQAQKDAMEAGKAVLQNAPRDYPEFQKIGIPRADNPLWTSGIFLDASGRPKPRFSAIVPDSQHMLITGRLGYGTGENSIKAIERSIRAQVAANPIPGASVIVTGVPILEAAVGRALRTALLVGMLGGAVAMALLLLLALRRRAPLASRVLPLAAGFFTVATLAGLLSAIDHAAVAVRGSIPVEAGFVQSVLATFSVGLNPATLAAFPVALGLAVDYSVQFLIRYRQLVEAEDPDPVDGARRRAGRATLRAAICTGVGLLALLSSAIPMVRQFGVVMVVGVGIAWGVSRLTVLAGVSLLARRGRRRAAAVAMGRQTADDDDAGLFGLAAARPGGSRLETARSGDRFGALAAWVRGHTSLVLAPALLLAVVGWGALPFATYETNVEKLVSPQLQAFRDLDLIRQVTGSGGELDFVLSGKDVTSEAALKWVSDLEAVAARDSQGQFKSEGSLAQLFSNINGGKTYSPEQTKALLAIMPGYFTDALVTRDHSLARVALGVPLGSISTQADQLHQVIRDVDPPPGYIYYPAGFSYLSIQGLQNLQGGQLLLNIGGAVLVLMALLAIYRHRRLALFAWLPTLLVAGWSTAVLFALRAPLTPMTAVLGALVVAFGTEFAVLWLERYREAVAAGMSPGDEAASLATRGAGPGIAVSGAALTLGFLALTIGGLPGVSSLGFDLPMVRDFGLVAAMDMVLAVLAALVVLPALVGRLGLPLAAASPVDPATPVASPSPA